jgi:hypothetical protein
MRLVFRELVCAWVARGVRAAMGERACRYIARIQAHQSIASALCLTRFPLPLLFIGTPSPCEIIFLLFYSALLLSQYGPL